MAGTMWFGTEEYAQWVPCPRINMAAGKVSWGTVAKYINGGNYVRRSVSAARSYTLEWGLKSRNELRPLLDYVDSFYGRGDLYFCDPFAMDRNVLPSYWATPYLNAIDGPLAASTWAQWPPTNNGLMTAVARPVLTNTGVSVNGFPTMSGGTMGEHRLFVPVPQGYTLWLSVHHTDSSSTGLIEIRTQEKAVPYGSIVYPTIQALNASVLGGYTFAATNPHMGVEISVYGNVYYTGMFAQILKTGVAPNTASPFISGQGHSGLQVLPPGFDYYEYSSALDQVQGSMSLLEVGAWR